MNGHKDAIEFLQFIGEAFEAFEDRLSAALRYDLMRSWLANQEAIAMVLDQHIPYQVEASARLEARPARRAFEVIEAAPAASLPEAQAKRPGKMIHIPQHCRTLNNGRVHVVPAHDRWYPTDRKYVRS